MEDLHFAPYIQRFGIIVRPVISGAWRGWIIQQHCFADCHLHTAWAEPMDISSFREFVVSKTKGGLIFEGGTLPGELNINDLQLFQHLVLHIPDGFNSFI
jgi:hypothetical protein